MDDGAFRESGTPEELIKMSGSVFKQLSKMTGQKKLLRKVAKKKVDFFSESVVREWWESRDINIAEHEIT